MVKGPGRSLAGNLLSSKKHRVARAPATQTVTAGNAETVGGAEATSGVGGVGKVGAGGTHMGFTERNALMADWL